MLVCDPKLRISASEALKQPWIAKSKADNKTSCADLKLSLRKLLNFRTQVLFQSAVLSYIASQSLPQQKEERIRQIFDVLDADKNGNISKKELIAGLKLEYNDEKRAKKEADQIFQNIVVKNKGYIDYNRIYLIIVFL